MYTVYHEPFLWTECRNGTSAEAGGQCKPCKENMFGYKCIAQCNCDLFHSCDAVVRCIPKTTFLIEKTTDAGNSSEGSTQAVILSTGVYITTQERAVIHKITTARSIVTDKHVTDVPNDVFITTEPNSISSGCNIKFICPSLHIDKAWRLNIMCSS
ncbi:unnamed protein product [Mytilus coruscus]|uniref:MEGF10_11 n=1 Tax=Mytilus coruscus TaxID=42192 RepID=A0A6J8C0J4_MYTCO|nr:unnamed protein product [Mytilus coruscus]